MDNSEATSSTETGISADTSQPDSPLARALAMVEERDARRGPVTMRQNGVDDVVTILRQIREEQTP